MVLVLPHLPQAQLGTNGDQGDSGAFPDLPAVEGKHGVEQGADISHLRHKPHFPFFITVGIFIWKKILQHIGQLALQDVENKQEGWEQQGGDGRAEENLTSVPGLGGNSLRAIFQSHLCSPGNKSWILEMLLEEKMYHKF